MPLLHQSYRKATRIPQSFPFLCLCSTSRTGRPYEYLKAFHSYASTSPVAAAGHTNTSKLPVHMPLPHQPLRQATRTLQSFPFLCLFSTSRTGRPYEYLKAFHSYASAPPVVPEGHTNTPKFSISMPLLHQSYRKAIRIPQSFPFLCLCSTSRTGRPFEYLKVFHSYASTSPVAAEGHSNTSKLSIHMPLLHQSYRKAFSQSQIQPSPVPGVSIRRDQWGSLHLRSGQRRPFSCSPCGRA